ncbi:MAG: response regulator transcription factor [Clostridiales bacterium]|nr:response regulator transcription factor [Clostridiales bacterium]
MQKIMIVEDDRTLNRGIALALQTPQRQLFNAFDLDTARRQLEQTALDLVILDLNLPDGNGLTLLRQLRAQSQVPVILLTANDLEADVVEGLAAGADDYVTKPFSLAILRARVAVQLRKQQQIGVYEEGVCIFDFAKQQFLVDEEPVALSRTEQRLLQILLENRGTTVPRERLLSYVWPDGTEFVEENALSVAVARLRGKLKGRGVIRTIYGIGYCWEGVQSK